MKWRRVINENSNFPPHDHIWATLGVLKNNECICNGEKTNLHKINAIWASCSQNAALRINQKNSEKVIKKVLSQNKTFFISDLLIGTFETF